MKVYVIMSFNNSAVCVCKSYDDATEMILSLMNEYYYDQFYVTCQNTFSWSAEKCLEYAKNLYYTDEYYWIEEVKFIHETLG